MKTLALPVLALALAAFAGGASAACPFSQDTVEKPEEKVENPSA